MWAILYLASYIPPNNVPDHQSERYLHLPARGHVRSSRLPTPAHAFANNNNSYFVTELLGTDLHRLLTSRPLEKQFIQYFLYQILVRGDLVETKLLGANLQSVA